MHSLENKLVSKKDPSIAEVEKLRGDLTSMGKDLFRLFVNKFRRMVLQNLGPHFRNTVQDREDLENRMSINQFYLILLEESHPAL